MLTKRSKSRSRNKRTMQAKAEWILRLAVWVVALGLGGLAQAQQNSEEEIQEIVVSAARLEQTLQEAARSVSIVDAKQIQQAKQQLSLAEVLQAVPGLYLQGRDNFSQDLRVSLRGFGARSSFGIRGIRIFVDDIPETLPDGQAQVDNIDLGSAKRIEVLRGPAAALYGNASGGVISVFSELGESQPYIESRVSAGEFGFRKVQLKATGKFQGLDVLFNAVDHKVDGFRDHSRAEGTLVSGKLGFDVNDTGRVLVSLNHNDQPVAEDPGGIDLQQASNQPSSARDRNVQFDAGEALQQTRLGIVYKKQANTSQLLLRNYFVWRDFTNLLPFTGGGAVDLERFFYGGGIQYVRDNFLTDSFQLTAGVDLDRQQDRRQRFDNDSGELGQLSFDQDEDVSSTGVYLQGIFRIGENIRLSTGLRHDHLSYDIGDRFLLDGDDSGDADFDETSVSAGASIDLPFATLFFNYASSFETPTTTEFANPDGSGGFNQQLNAQSADSFEVGLRGAGKSYFYELAMFHIDLDDELTPFELAAFPGRTFFSNSGTSSRFGIEANLQLKLTRGWSAEFSYTYSDFDFDAFLDANNNDFSGNRLPGVPEHFAYGQLSYAADSGLFATLEASYSGKRFADNGNLVEASSYTLTNFRAAYRKQLNKVLLEPFIGINNLFDQRYSHNIRINAFGGRFFEPASPRHVYAGLLVRFQ